MAMNKYGGVNDMPIGYTKTEYGKRIYTLWFDMLRRCYDETQLARKKGRSYVDVVVCDRWLYLRNFAEDIAKLDGYDKWLLGNSMALDKDVSVQVATKIYSPKTCRFVTAEENLKEMNNRCSPVEKAKEAAKTKYVLFKGDEYHIFDTEKDACAFLEVKQCSVAGAWRDKCKCKGWNVIRIGNSADMRGDNNEAD